MHPSAISFRSSTNRSTTGNSSISIVRPRRRSRSSSSMRLTTTIRRFIRMCTVASIRSEHERRMRTKVRVRTFVVSSRRNTMKKLFLPAARRRRSTSSRQATAWSMSKKATKSSSRTSNTMRISFRGNKSLNAKKRS